jgi:S1-C subfamily serine protease
MDVSIERISIYHTPDKRGIIRSPRRRDGIYQGDVVVEWNGQSIRHVQSVLHALGPDSIGQTVRIGVRRAGETKQVSLTIAERPAA